VCWEHFKRIRSEFYDGEDVIHVEDEEERLRGAMKRHNHIDKAKDDTIKYAGIEVDVKSCDRDILLGLIGAAIEKTEEDHPLKPPNPISNGEEKEE
jgi:hypothetical protein